MKDLSLHILDVAENSIRAEAKRIEISIVEDVENDVLTLEITDDGKGMDPEMARRAAEPFFTTKSERRIGLGLALLARAAREAGGQFELSTSPGAGAKVRASFRYSHPDRKPLGDMAATLRVLVGGNPGLDLSYHHKKGARIVSFDTREPRPS